MESTVQLQPDFVAKYPYAWVLGLFLLITFIYSIARIQKKKAPKQQKKKNTQKKYQPKHTLSPLQIKYLNMLDGLKKQVNEDDKTVKDAFQELSLLYRDFIQLDTGMEVTKNTLSELKTLGKPIIYKLVEMYYSPEFSDLTYDKADFNKAIEETRKAIKEWN